MKVITLNFNESQQLLQSVRKNLEVYRYFGEQCRSTKDNLLMRISEEDFDKVIR
jgi:hypothetical protein